MERFFKVIEDTISLFEEYLPLEHEKIAAVQVDDVATVEDCMRREQAVILKLRGLEQKRETIQRELGWEGKTFKEIIHVAPEESRQELSSLFDRMENSVNTFKDANDSAMETMSLHLREIERIIKVKDENGRYGNDGAQVNSGSFMTNRKV